MRKDALLLVWILAATVDATQEQIAAAQTRKLLADRAWFSQIARIKADAGGRSTSAVNDRMRGTCASDSGACLAVTEPPQPGVTVEGYELVERAALLGVCNQPLIEPPASLATQQEGHEQEDEGEDGGLAGDVSSERDALGLLPPAQYDAGIEEMSADNEDAADGYPGATGETASQLVCPLPLGSSEKNSQVAPTKSSDGVADGPTLEYQVSLLCNLVENEKDHASCFLTSALVRWSRSVYWKTLSSFS